MLGEYAFSRAVVRDILDHASVREWSIQGFGMMRTYIGPDARYRLNIWHKDLSVPNVSRIHTHPWDFTSYIIAGTMGNQRYSEGAGTPYQVLTLTPGPSGGPLPGSRGTTKLYEKVIEHYYEGDVYSQRADEIHATLFADGSVTINDRIRHGADEARSFWGEGDWVDAKPRPATPEEIEKYVGAALSRMSH